MPQSALDELTPADVSLLREERSASAHMHVGTVSVLEGPAPPIAEFRAHVLARLERVPRYRTAVVAPPLGIGRPHWAVDPNFTIDFHVRHGALPRPGDDAEFRTAAARFYSQRLDHRRPLWELWMVEGLEDGRFAVLTKSHQALVDGVVASDLMTALFDDGAGDGHVLNTGSGRWLAPPPPTSAQIVASAARNVARSAVQRPLGTVAALARPAGSVALAAAGAVGIGGRFSERLKPAPASPLNVPIGPHRRLARAAVPVADLERVKDTFGGTVNDVVLAVVAGAVRHWMLDRGLRTEGIELRAAVPVAIHGTRRAPRPIALLRAPLPIGETDPLVRYERIRRAMSESTAGRHPMTAAERMADSDRFAPPSLLAQVARLRMNERRFNLVVANVPGPQDGVFLLGRRLEETYPVPFLSGHRALAVAATSYAGTAEFGLLGDLDKLADIDVVADGVIVSAAELLALARRGRQARRVHGGAPTDG